MAIILVQHLDPNHASMMVELLASHTPMTVVQATEGALIERNHLYVIPPGQYLAVKGGALQLVAPTARHGARLPVDFLLHALAEDCGPRAVCVILSGSGTDGSLGLKSVRERQGLVIAQDPAEAGFDGMPRSAIATGGVDHVLALAKIPAVLVAHAADLNQTGSLSNRLSEDSGQLGLGQVIDLLRAKTAHDFRLYKQGTLQRRIERRMTLANIERTDTERYLALLHSDESELALLAKDLLINVTSFFRDPRVFEHLSETVIPGLVRDHTHDVPLRIWIAGCSTGEEAYSFAMLFREQIAAAHRNIKLQVFASDVDPEAIATAREGLFPHAIEADVSAERLTRFFSKEDHGYKVSEELRASVVFTVQDVLADPPFSRLDLISCRNLLIYLGAEAQAKVISLFHFALRKGGMLLLGSSETAGDIDGRFEVISKPDRLYRAIGHSRLNDFGLQKSVAEFARSPARPGVTQAPSRQAALADLCRRLVLETYAPAAVLINAKHECLYSLGPVHRYLRLAEGHPSQDLLAMAHGGLRTKLRSAIHQVTHGQASLVPATVVMPGGRNGIDGVSVPFTLNVRSIPIDGETLTLICFVDEPSLEPKKDSAGVVPDVSRVAELELELEATRTELQGAIHNLEISGEEQKAINEEALSVNEEFQSTNEELLTSKEELQSLNEELTALNTQLQETLDRQRCTANDLQNILYSTDVATLFLDLNLNIRFFTPATKSVFSVIAGDVGRPLSDLNSLSADRALAADARAVLNTLDPIEREIETQQGHWFIRRILPYRTLTNTVEGIVITFTDISERKAIREALDAAKQEAERANLAKSRFLAAASHDLRQPLQTMTLIQGLLTRTVEGEKAPKLVARLGDTLGAMSGMLNTLLDINQIEAGVMRADPVTFPINELFDHLRDEFTYHAEAKKLTLRVMPSRLSVHSDPHLLEQMLRNLVSNAIKYTKKGTVLVGCRRCHGGVRIEIWDTGLGIPESQLGPIFEEYRQLDNSARERSRGLGLGLSIVQRIAALLGHKIAVRSQSGKGSVFAIELGPAPQAARSNLRGAPRQSPAGDVGGARTGSILVVEDDPDVREMIELLLKSEGHEVTTAKNGPSAMGMVLNGSINPDLVLADYNLPDGLTGLQVGGKLRDRLARNVPVVILTGDISTATSAEILAQGCNQLTKPVKLKELTQVIQSLLGQPRNGAAPPIPATQRTASLSPEPRPDIIHVVDDDSAIRDQFRTLFEEQGYAVETYPTGEAFLAAHLHAQGGCVLIDADLPGMSGLDVLRRLRVTHDHLAAIIVTGHGDVELAVQAMKSGASEFIEKPATAPELLACVARSLEQSRDRTALLAWRENAAKQIATLTPRQREIMDLVLAGHPSKRIAADLGISQRTVENHRALIMKNTGATSLPALARLALAAVPAD